MAVTGTRRKRDEDELTANLRRSLDAVRSMAAAYRNHDERAFMAAARCLAELTVERLQNAEDFGGELQESNESTHDT